MSTTPSEAARPGAARSPFAWIPSLYFAEGVPYMVVTAVSVVMLKSLGMSNAQLAFWTSWIGLPWIIKPLWTPLVDLYGSKRLWIVATELAMAFVFLLAAFAMPLSFVSQAILALFMALAFFSATHDASADGFYMLALEPHEQAAFSGVRSAFYRCATIAAQGGLVILAGFIESHSGLTPSRFEVYSAGDGAAIQRLWQSSSPVRPRDIEISFPDSGASFAGAAPSPSDLTAFRDAVKSWNAGEEGAEDPFKMKAPAGCVRAMVSLPKPLPDGEPRQLSLSRSSWWSKSVVLVEGDILNFSREGQVKCVLLKIDPNSKGAWDVTFEARSGDIRLSWSVCLCLAFLVFAALGVYHQLFLPRPERSFPHKMPGAFAMAIANFAKVFKKFFMKKGVFALLAFLLLYRFAESQLLKLFAPFMLDSRSVGGLGLSMSEQGFIYGTVGIACLMIGGVIGGLAVAKHGLGRWLIPMCLVMNTPDLLFVYLSQFQPEGLLPIAGCVAVEQLGYGFGFTAFMLVMVQFAENSGHYKTSHYAIMTGFMALGMMLPGMFAGALQQLLGYKSFFLWILVCIAPSLLATLAVKRIVDPAFGLADAKR